MVKEVEFSNTIVTLGEDQDYSNSPDQDLFVAHLSNSSKTLNVKVRVPLTPQEQATRKMYLQFANVDFISKEIEYLDLAESDFDHCTTTTQFTDKTYTFDISRVLTIPRRIYSTGSTSEITIELYTYEANITTDYGTKTLSVPYSITSNTNYKYNESTDGVYRFIMVDFEPFLTTRSYGIGDIVAVNDILYKSLIDNNTSEVTVTTAWRAPTKDEIIFYCQGTTKFPPIRGVVSHVMISRYAKYKIIKDILLATSFKEYDDIEAFSLVSLLQNIRERAKYQLLVNKPIEALKSLDLIHLDSSKFDDTTKVHTYKIQYKI